jgi:polar amino acid transport system substrate-binding protein
VRDLTEMTRIGPASMIAAAVAAMAMAPAPLSPRTGLRVAAAALAAAALAADQGFPEPAEGDGAAVREGHSLFNQTCAHCHGPNAVTGLPERNLRHLHLRYGDDMWRVFHATVVHGRPEKGMPVWGEILDEKTIARIYAYLKSVQSETE